MAAAAIRITPEGDVALIAGILKDQLKVAPEEWLVSRLATDPVISHRFLIDSTYHAPVKVAREDILEGCRVIDFSVVEDCFGVGLQILLAPD